MKYFLFAIIVIGVAILGITFIFYPHQTRQSFPDSDQLLITKTLNIPDTAQKPEEPTAPVVTHIPTPKAVKGVYMSSWIASSVKARQHVIDLIDKTEINAVIIDIKDDTGRISFSITDPIVAKTGSPENRIRDIVPFIQELHAKGIYVIGREQAFQDPYMAKIRPDWAIKKKSDGSVWKDRKGLPFLDPSNQEVWDYLVAIGKASYAVGFDEINFDYIRYPSDGNIKDINYQLKEGKTRADTIESFFLYLHDHIKETDPIVISADLFGMTTTEKTDMGIGQVLEKALPHFDYIAPMIYPSHYADYAGFKHAVDHPYEVVLAALKGAQVKSPESFQKIRPWLQDFSLGKKKYGEAEVKAQIKATYDAGLESWMMWDPSNRYTTSAYQKV